MTRTFSGDGIYIAQRDFQQILLRGKGDGRFAETVNGEISLLPPKDNLRMISNENYLFAKQSFDQRCYPSIAAQAKPQLLRSIPNLLGVKVVACLYLRLSTPSWRSDHHPNRVLFLYFCRSRLPPIPDQLWPSSLCLKFV